MDVPTVFDTFILRINEKQVVVIKTVLFCALEKTNGEYQLAPGACYEKWQVHSRHQINVEVTTTGQSKVDHTCQQCTTPKV